MELGWRAHATFHTYILVGLFFFFFEMFQTFVMKVLKKKKDKVEKKSIISFLKARWLLKNSKFFFHFCYYVL